MSIGIAIITHNRWDSFIKVVESTVSGPRVDVIINDGDPFNAIQLTQLKALLPHAKIIENPTNLGVSRSKNIAFYNLLQDGSEYMFIIEDDIEIIDHNVFDAYIDVHKKTGIHHFSFMGHGPANKNGISGGVVIPRQIIEYPDCSIALARHSIGAFCFYTRECINRVGVFDERFYQAFDHVDHTYRIYKEGLTTPYWWFADINKSWEYLKETACSEVSSSIRFKDTEKWHENIQNACRIFEQKHGYKPAWDNAVPDVNLDSIKRVLKDIYEEKKN